MKCYFELSLCILFTFYLEKGHSGFHAIRFPTDPPTIRLPSIGDPCNVDFTEGTCLPLHRCKPILNQIRSHGILFRDVRCGDSRQFNNHDLVCCQSTKKVVAEITDISPPEGIYDQCGIPYVDFLSVDLRNIYEGNNTAEDYKSKGFSVIVRDVDIDHITAFDYTNGSFRGTWPSKRDEMRFFPFVVGGIDARRVLAVYMALLGNDQRWFCDGALINSQWVLTAAHCFTDQAVTKVRLGEFDFSDETVTSTEVPVDFSVLFYVIHPEYKFPSSHHDLALIKLDRKTPHFRPDISPVCLPWGIESRKNLVSESVTLTGWGASVFFGPSTPILQEANVTVFDPSVCDKSYSKLNGYSSSFPGGIRKETSLCAGDEQGGKDACQGDSGGPIVYLDEKHRYTLAGIVSTGNGCGLKEFPGIYIPMHNPKYLSWIKKVAFL